MCGGGEQRSSERASHLPKLTQGDGNKADLGQGQLLLRRCICFYKPESRKQGLLYFTLIMMEPGTVRATPVMGQKPRWPLPEL